MDDNANAFVDETNRIYISTGLLKYIESYEALVGVVAHEIGHITKYHIPKRKDSKAKLKKLNDLANLSIIAGSLVSKNQDYLMQSLISNKLGISNYYQLFSQDQEKEADYYAVETMNKLDLSTKPLVMFLNFLEEKAIRSGMAKEYYKFSSHPIYEERLEIIDNSKNNKIYKQDQQIKKKI